VHSSKVSLGVDQICPGDSILLSGSVGDHGTAILLAREQFGLSGNIKSDSASVFPITQALLGIPGLRFMRDPTRGGIATVAHEIVHATGASLHLKETSIPVRDPVRAVCDMLGYDPLYLASEGRVVAVLDSANAELALNQLKGLGYSDAAIIGTVKNGGGQVILETDLGGMRILAELEDDPLPRIC
jgi:hydrogenase expression/formation protein HypE